jgi:hypothetical protein
MKCPKYTKERGDLINKIPYLVVLGQKDKDLFINIMSCNFNNYNSKITNAILYFTNKSFETRRGLLPENYISDILAVQTLCAFFIILGSLCFYFSCYN